MKSDRTARSLGGTGITGHVPTVAVEAAIRPVDEPRGTPRPRRSPLSDDCQILTRVRVRARGSQMAEFGSRA